MSRYIAFISYRHIERDQKISALLRRKLESFRVPADSGLPAKRKAFRDTDELPTSSDLGADIEEALADSGCLIALCSPEYVKSKWCMREVSLFIESGRKDRILPVLVSGDRETSVPEELRDLPLAADLSGLSGMKLRQAADRAVSGILAFLSGSEEGEIARSERRRRYLIGSAVAAAAFAVILGFAMYAMKTAKRISENNIQILEATDDVRKAEAEAELERNEALIRSSRYYARKAWQAIDRGDDTEAVALALQGLPESSSDDTPYVYEALSALRMGLSLPADPDYHYELRQTVETDFSVRGWQIGRDGIYLTEEDNFSPEKQPARLLELGTGTLRDPEKIPSRYSEDMMINGEPFIPDHIYTDPYGKRLAWLDANGEGQQPFAAIFERNKGEAAAVPDLEGSPVSVSSTGSRLAVVDDRGILTVYNAYTGEKLSTADGTYISAVYTNSIAALMAVTAEGRGFLYDTADFSVMYEMESPAPIKTMYMCTQHEGWALACCTDGFRIISITDGSLLMEVRTEEEPLYAVWGGYDDMTFQHDGNIVVLIFEHKTEIYSLKSEENSASLYQPLFIENGENQCSTVFFSQDGRRIFLQQYHGELSAWDTATASMIWSNEENMWQTQGNIHEESALSADGTAIWRVTDSMSGYDKVDAETGKIIYTSDYGLAHITMPKEYPGRGLGMCRGLYGSRVVVFDTATGEKLWETDESAVYQFSEDGSRVLSIGKADDTDREITEVWYVSRDAGTGEEIDRILLGTADYNEDCYVYLNDRGDTAVIIRSVGVHHYYLVQDYIVSTYDLPSGNLRGETTLNALGAGGIRSYNGEIAVELITEEGGYMCPIKSDGTVGGPVPKDSEAGRRLLIEKGRYHRFAGEEVYTDCDRRYDPLTESQIWHADMRRISDDAVVIRREGGIWMELAVSPDGENACMYGYYMTPLLIRAGDMDSLIAAGRRMTGGTYE